MLGAEFSVPVFKTKEEADAYADALRDTAVRGARGVARGSGVIDFLAGVPWLAQGAYSQMYLDSLLASPLGYDKLGPKPGEPWANSAYAELSRLRKRSLKQLGQQGDDEEAKKKTKERADARINQREEIFGAGNYEEWANTVLDTIFPLPFEANEKSQIIEDVAFWATVGVDVAFLLKAIVQAAPKGYAFVRNAIKNIGENMDEADQAVMKTQKAFSEKTVDKPVPLLTDQRVDKVDEILKPKAKDVRDIDPAIVEKRIGNLEKKRDKELTRIGNREKAELLKKHGVARDLENPSPGYFFTAPPGMTQEALNAAYLQTSKKYSPMKEAARKKWKKKMDLLYEELDEANRYYKGEMKKKKEFSPETEKILGLDPDSINKEGSAQFLQNRAEDVDALAERFNKDKRVLEIEKRFQAKAKQIVEDFKESGNEALLNKRTVEAKKSYQKEMEKVLIELNEETDRFVHTRRITELARGGIVQNSVDYALDQWS